MLSSFKDIDPVAGKIAVYVFLVVQFLLVAMVSAYSTATWHRVNGLLQYLKVLTDQVGG